MLVRWVWVASLVLVLVKRANAQQAPSTLKPGHGDGVANAAVRQPTVVTSVQARPPGRKQLTRRRQHSAVVYARLPRLLQGEFTADRWGEEDLAFKQSRQTNKNKSEV